LPDFSDTALAAYLTRTGWTEIKDHSGRGWRVFEKTNADNISVPLSCDDDGAHRRMLRRRWAVACLSEIAAAEGRPATAIAAEISN
jgi:hypothetical protein